MKKIIYVLDINYDKRIKEITMPSIKAWAKRIGASIKIINKRKYPEYPITYEKFQMYDMALKEKADWHIFVDADVLINNNFPDVVEYVPKQNVLVTKGGYGGHRFKYDDCFRRYGQHLDVGTWFFAFSDWCLDAFKPPHLQGMDVKKALTNFLPTIFEKNALAKIPHDHFIDDYMFGRNIAKYGLRISYLAEFLPDALNSIWHTCFDTNEVKYHYLKAKLDEDNNRVWTVLNDEHLGPKIRQAVEQEKIEAGKNSH